MAQPIPHEVVAVQGCTCPGSLDTHFMDCHLFELTEEQYWERVDAARGNLRSWMERTYGHGA